MAVVDAILQAGAAVGWVSAELDGECEHDKVGNFFSSKQICALGFKSPLAGKHIFSEQGARQDERARAPAVLDHFLRAMHFYYTDVS